jgi:hypothetical protein
MLLVSGNTMITASVIHSIIVSPIVKENKEYPRRYWYKPETWFLEPTVTTKTLYRLTLDYVRTDGASIRFTSESPDYGSMDKIAKEFLKQVKMQTDIANQELVDKLFEDAVKETQ